VAARLCARVAEVRTGQREWANLDELQRETMARLAPQFGLPALRATVLLIELVISKHDRDFPGKWVDLEMLLNLGARERTAVEYRDLLSQAGFQMTRVVQTASPLSVVEARTA
jgi:hypothetical protein